MTLSESISAALAKKTELLKKETAEYDGKIEALLNENPEFSKTEGEISKNGAKLALCALVGNEKQLDELKTTLTALNEKKQEMLKTAGIDGIKYECEECRDTGYKDGRICDCIKKSAREIMLAGLSKSAPVYKCTLDNFDLSYYSDPTAKKRMTAILKLAREYVLGFKGKDDDNLLFMGNTGLGKTHISLGIAGELIAKGFDVVYGSAYNLFSKMESEHFSEHTNTKYEAAINCDLLLIDDLGGEFVSPYVLSLIYNIINTRILSSKPTVINTNLSMKEIENTYTPRVASRLIGDYTAKMFLGSDVRQLKALSNKKD